MDAQRLSPLPRLSRRARRARRVQRQIHEQPDGAPRRILRDIAKPHPPDLPQFLPTGKTLAIHRHPARARPGMSATPSGVALLDLEPATSDFLDPAVAGLSSSPRMLPSKFFYDERGSDLFQQICELPEYYVTRTETEILRQHGAQIAESLGGKQEVVGFGTGAGNKTRMLLGHLKNPIAYVPVYISKQRLMDSAAALQREMPDLEILPVCADYLQPLRL